MNDREPPPLERLFRGLGLHTGCAREGRIRERRAGRATGVTVVNSVIVEVGCNRPGKLGRYPGVIVFIVREARLTVLRSRPAR